MATELEQGGKEHSNPIPWSPSLGHFQLPLDDLGDNDNTCWRELLWQRQEIQHMGDSGQSQALAKPLNGLLRYSCDPSHYTTVPRVHGLESPR